MKNLLVLALLFSFAAALFAEDDGYNYQTVYFIGFEEAEGYELGALNGQCDWKVFNENFNFRLVDDSESYSGNNSVYVFTGDTKNSGSKKELVYENPDGMPVQFSFMIKPSFGPVRFLVFDANNNRIKKFAMNYQQLTLDNPFRTVNFPEELDTNAWYKVFFSFDPNDSFIEPIQIFPDGSTNAIIETNAEYDTQGAAAGEPFYFAIATEWTDTSTCSYIDDITVRTMTIPEPVFIGLAALAGLFLLRKRG